MNVVTVIQSRTTSTRLNRKILLPLGNSNILIQMIERVKNAITIGQIVIATTHNSEDDEIELLCKEIGVDCFRGHPTDCLDRHYQVGVKYKAKVIVKIPSDCPLIDPAIIDKVIGGFLENPNEWDYYSNLHPATYPDGNDVEVMTMEALEKAWVNSKIDFEKEHTTPYIWERPKEFRLGNVVCESGYDYSTSYRWTLDFIEDYWLINAIFNSLYKDNPFFGVYDILELLDHNPAYRDINEMHLGKYWYMNHLDQLKNINEYKASLK